MIEPEGEVDIREAYPLMDAVARAEGWEDTAMDSYNVYAHPAQKTAEISYDLVMEDDMAFVEGTYRLARGAWQVFIFSKWDNDEISCEPSTWDSGVSGVVVFVPRNMRLNKRQVLELLSQVLAVENWSEVRGPDSIVLR